MRSSNPVLNNEAFAPKQWGGIAADLRDGPRFGSSAGAVAKSTTMTITGTVIKTSILLALTIASASGTAIWLKNGGAAAVGQGALIGASLGALALSLVIAFVPKTAPFLAPVYALLKGAFVGAISLFVAARAGDAGAAMVTQAIALTFGIFAALLGAYAFGLIRIGGTMARVILVATAGVALTYIAQMVASMMGFPFLGAIHQSGWIGIGFSLFVVALASLNLVMDFQTIENGVENKAPKYMEWYGGFALLVTLIWLYIEILQLLRKLNQRE